MVKKSRGFRRGTRKKLKQRPSKRPAITKFLRTFNHGEKVMLFPEPASQRGMPFPRYKGKVGMIIGRQGSSYLVEIVNGKKKKTIISRPEHLKRV